MAWFKIKKNPAAETSNRAIEQKLDRIIELLETSNHTPQVIAQRVSGELAKSLQQPLLPTSNHPKNQV